MAMQHADRFFNGARTQEFEFGKGH